MNITLEEFKERYFQHSAHPSLSTLRRLSERGEIPAKKFGKRWFVNTAMFESNGDPLLAKILSDEPRAA